MLISCTVMGKNFAHEVICCYGILFPQVPNLFEPEEYEKVLAGTRPAAKDAGIAENDRDGVFAYFISQVRNNLHIVLCMSPVGEAFRTRCRMFPSLVNCCTIDWFTEWPR